MVRFVRDARAWIAATVLLAPSAAAEPVDMRLIVPTRMVHDKTLTIIAELLDANGDIDWRTCTATGAVSAVRTDTQEPVPISITVFDSHNGTPPEDSIFFYNGSGSVSITLDNGAEEPTGDIDVTVTFGELQRTKTVTLIDGTVTLQVSGTLTGSDLDWSPEDGVIHVVGNAAVPSGETLTIAPGTLIMVDPGAQNDGTLVDVSGSVNSIGTEEDPIYFFTSAGAAGMRLMELCSDPRSNFDSWRGVWHRGGDTSNYAFTIVTGTGNGSLQGHARPPAWRFVNAHSFEIERCFFVDNPGKCMFGIGSGSYHLSKSLFSRSGHGVNWEGPGNYTLLVEDCVFSGLGWGEIEVDCGIDADCMNIRADRSGNEDGKIVRRCIFADGGDDAIDTLQTSPLIENCILWGMRDKTISMEGVNTEVHARNLLIFNSRYGFDGHVDSPYVFEQSTIAFPRTNPFIRNRTGTLVDKCILWPQPWDTCRTQDFLSYTLVGIGSDTSCDEGNFAANPQFANPNLCDFSLRPDSPALRAGPNGERIGWLGFPEPFACVTDEHCYDGSECTTDTCQDGVCAFDTQEDCLTAILPEGFTVTRGTFVSGGLPELLDSDDARVVVQAVRQTDLNTPSVEIELTATSPIDAPGEIRFRVEAATSGAPSRQRIELFDYKTSRWVVVDQRAGVDADTVVSVSVTENAQRFVEPGTRAMKARVGYLDLGITFLAWNGRYDHAFWNVDP